MKKLVKFFNTTPSYLKCGNSVIAAKTNLSEKFVAKFKTTKEFKALKRMYINTICN